MGTRQAYNNVEMYKCVRSNLSAFQQNPGEITENSHVSRYIVIITLNYVLSYCKTFHELRQNITLCHVKHQVHRNSV
jgi:hypothetical protein